MTQHERRGGDPGEQTPGQIEQQIERTRERLTQNMDELGERLRPANLKREAQEAIAEKAQHAAARVGGQARQTGTRVADFVSAHRLPSGAAGLGVILLVALTRERSRSAGGSLLGVAVGATVMGLALGWLLPEPEYGLAGETRNGFAGRATYAASRVKEVAMEAVRRQTSSRRG